MNLAREHLERHALRPEVVNGNVDVGDFEVEDRVGRRFVVTLGVNKNDAALR